MAEFRKQGGFGGGAKRAGGYRPGGADRPQFARKGGFGGAPRGRDDSRPPQMHEATCADCGKRTEVPFRPVAGRPVFCKDCFGEKRDAPQGDYGRRDTPRGVDSRREAPSRSFEQREFAPPRAAAPQAPAPDKRIDELSRSVEIISRKLDQLVSLLQATHAPKQAETTVVTKKVAVKKVAKAKAKAKK